MNIPDVAETIGGLVAYAAKQEKKNLREDELYEVGGLKMKITSLRDGIIEMVEVIEEKTKHGQVHCLKISVKQGNSRVRMLLRLSQQLRSIHALRVSLLEILSFFPVG